MCGERFQVATTPAGEDHASHSSGNNQFSPDPVHMHQRGDGNPEHHHLEIEARPFRQRG